MLIPFLFVIGTAASQLDTFNKAMIDAHRRMDNAAVLALWEDDGVSLLPGVQPIAGKEAVGKMLADMTARYPGAHMLTFTFDCADVFVSGDWASEWCNEHQVVALGDNRPPFDGWGKMLFVLHRGSDGNWRIKSEMWNQGVMPPPSR